MFLTTQPINEIEKYGTLALSEMCSNISRDSRNLYRTFFMHLTPKRVKVSIDLSRNTQIKRGKRPQSYDKHCKHFQLIGAQIIYM